MTELRWAVIGAGRFGTLHARAVRSLDGCRLVGLCNRNPRRLADVAAEFPGLRYEQDYRCLLDDPAVDVVSVTTHWRDHFVVARDALRAGKHVLLEKPMAATSDECDQLVAAAEASSGKLLVGHICRFDPRVALAREAILQGRLGRIVTMHAKRNLPRAPGALRLNKISPLMGDGIHDADLMMWFLGRAPSRIYACHVRVDDFDYPDVGWAMLEFGGDAVGVVETNWRLPANVSTAIDARMEIIGTEGKLEIDCSATGLSVLDSSGRREIDTDYWPTVHGLPAGVLRFELEYFARCIRQNLPIEVITPREAARAVAVMERAEQAATGGLPLAFP